MPPFPLEVYGTLSTSNLYCRCWRVRLGGHHLHSDERGYQAHYPNRGSCGCGVDCTKRVRPIAARRTSSEVQLSAWPLDHTARVHRHGAPDHRLRHLPVCPNDPSSYLRGHPYLSKSSGSHGHSHVHSNLHGSSDRNDPLSYMNPFELLIFLAFVVLGIYIGFFIL